MIYEALTVRETLLVGPDRALESVPLLCSVMAIELERKQSEGFWRTSWYSNLKLLISNLVLSFLVRFKQVFQLLDRALPPRMVPYPALELLV